MNSKGSANSTAQAVKQVHHLVRITDNAGHGIDQRRLAGRAPGPRMRAEDDPVAGLQADQGLDDCREGRIGRRHDAADDGLDDGPVLQE